MAVAVAWLADCSALVTCRTWQQPDHREFMSSSHLVKPAGGTRASSTVTALRIEA